jgi:aminoglycoside phosphotransferase (APT) family kinase protein
MDEAALLRLADWITGALGIRAVRIKTVELLKGGSIQQNWLINVAIGAQQSQLIVRTDAPAVIAESRSRAEEFVVLQCAHAAGVAVPTPIAYCADASVFGRPFSLIEKVNGTAFGPRVVKDVSLGGDRRLLAERLGRELAKIHRIVPPEPRLVFFGALPASPAQAEIDRIRGGLDRLRARRPALEWGLRWAELNAPKSGAITLTHRDYRTGNYMVNADGLVAILDWEFSGWGDPLSDLGWFCAECWRFGRRDLEAGGIGRREDFYKGYETESGQTVDDAAVRYWEIVAHMRWAVITLQQGERHRSNREPSLELALTSRIASELELTVVRATAPAVWRRAHGT